MAIGGFLGASLGAAVVQVGLDARALESGLVKAKSSVQSGTTSMTSSAGKMKAAWLGFAAVAGAAIIKFGADSVKSALEAEKAQIRLQNTLANNADLGDVTADSWEKQAAALQDLTGVQDEAIMGAQALLGQFELTGSQVQELIPLIVDLSEKMGIDMEAAAKAVGKATQGSAGILSRYGIVLDKTALASDAFGATLDGLKGKVGGFSAAMGTTFQGRMRILAANFDDVKEKIGFQLIPILDSLVTAFGALEPILGHVANNLGTIIAVGTGFLAWKFLPGLLAQIAMGLQAVGAAGAASRLAGVGMGLKQIGMSALRSAPYVIGLVQGFKLLGDTLDEDQTFLDAIGNQLEDVTNLLGLHANGLSGVLEGYPPFEAAMANAAAQADGYASAMDQASQATRDLKNAQLQLAGGMLGLVSSSNSAREAEADLATARAELNELTRAGKQGTDEYKAAQANLRSAQLNSVEAQLSLTSAVADYTAKVQSGEVPRSRAIADLRRMGADAGLTKSEVNGLIGRILAIPDEATTIVTAETAGAQAAVDAFIAGVSGNTVYINVVATGSGTTYAKLGSYAEGAILGASNGLIARGPTMLRSNVLVGEGGYNTFAGRGAEAVVPLNDRGIDILAEAVRRGMKGSDGAAYGGPGRVVHLHIQQSHIPIPQLAREVSRYLSEGA